MEKTEEATEVKDLRPGLYLMLGEREYLIGKLEAECADIKKNLDELNDAASLNAK